MAETLDKVFIDVEVDASIAGDAELAKKLEEVCPVDIFAATDTPRPAAVRVLLISVVMPPERDITPTLPG